MSRVKVAVIISCWQPKKSGRKQMEEAQAYLCFYPYQTRAAKFGIPTIQGRRCRLAQADDAVNAMSFQGEEPANGAHAYHPR